MSHLTREKKMDMVDKLCDIYNRWGEKEENKNLAPLTSASEVLWNETITEKQTKWIERFINVWEKVMDRDYERNVTIKEK